MIRIQLDEVTRAELHALRHSALSPKVRDRLEMVLLSAAGWSPPRIAAFLDCDPQTVRKVLHGFRQRGQQALTPGQPGPAPDTARRDRLTGLLRDLLGQQRTWTSAQLADALRPHDIELGSRQVRRYLRLLNASYRRTASTLEHKQDPAKVARAEGVLGNLKKKRRPAN
jgi:putative transposase